MTTTLSIYLSIYLYLSIYSPHAVFLSGFCVHLAQPLIFLVLSDTARSGRR